MSGNFLLDTNIVIALFGGDTLVQKRIATNSKFFVPCLVLGELYYGAQKSRRVNENMTKIKDFIANSTVLNCDSNTALEYAIIKNQLRKRGCPIPENDIWIAVSHLYEVLQGHNVPSYREMDFNSSLLLPSRFDMLMLSLPH